MPVRVGFVGCGLIAAFHAHGLSTVDEADIAVVFDTDAVRGAAFAAAHGGRVVASVDDVIAGSDAVYVTTWTSAHPEIVGAVVAAGKPVFCEKPLGVDLSTARRMVETVEAAGVVNQVGLVLRHSPAFRWLRDEVAGGSHGAPMSMIFRDDQFIPVQGMYASDWRGDPARAGSGALLEHSIHDLDLIEWIMGPIVDVSCRTAHHHGIEGIEDQASVLLTAESGAHALLSSTWHDIHARPSLRSMEVFCRDAHFTVEGDWIGPVRRQSADGREVELEGRDLALCAREIDGRRQNPDADFVAAVVAGRPAHPGFRTALRAHELADAAYRSAASGGTPVVV